MMEVETKVERLKWFGFEGENGIYTLYALIEEIKDRTSTKENDSKNKEWVEWVEQIEHTADNLEVGDECKFAYKGLGGQDKTFQIKRFSDL